MQKTQKNPIILRNAEKPHAAGAAFAQALYYESMVGLKHQSQFA
jgi:hypothetical protein